MKQKIYNFKKKKGFIGNVEYEVSDYFQFYHTGIETIIPDNMLVITQRHNNERSEVLAYELLDSANLSDTILALNNDVYLWDSPYDNDMFEEMVDITLNYIQRVYKTTMTPPVLYRFEEHARELVTEDDDMLRNVVLPKKEQVQKISRIIKDNLKSRIVK